MVDDDIDLFRSAIDYLEKENMTEEGQIIEKDDIIRIIPKIQNSYNKGKEDIYNDSLENEDSNILIVDMIRNSIDDKSTIPILGLLMELVQVTLTI